MPRPFQLRIGDLIDPATVEPLCPPCWGDGASVATVPGEDGRLVCPACGKPYPPDDALDLDEDDEAD
jgi:hypothetical protein